VVRKGAREVQELPAPSDAFLWLRLYQVEMQDAVPLGQTQPLWWTLRRPVRPLTCHAAHRMFERASTAAGAEAALHALRHRPSTGWPRIPRCRSPMSSTSWATRG